MQLANLIAGDVHIAQLADTGRDRVRNFVTGDERVDDGAGAADGLARVGIEEDGAADVEVRHFAHGFEREIVSVDVQGVQGSSQIAVLISQMPFLFRIRASL